MCYLTIKVTSPTLKGSSERDNSRAVSELHRLATSSKPVSDTWFPVISPKCTSAMPAKEVDEERVRWVSTGFNTLSVLSNRFHLLC